MNTGLPWWHLPLFSLGFLVMLYGQRVFTGSYRVMAVTGLLYPLGKIAQNFLFVPYFIRGYLSDGAAIPAGVMLLILAREGRESRDTAKHARFAIYVTAAACHLEAMQSLAGKGDVIDVLSYGVGLGFSLWCIGAGAEKRPTPAKKGPACRKPSHRSSRRPRH